MENRLEELNNSGISSTEITKDTDKAGERLNISNTTIQLPLEQLPTLF